MRWEGFLQSILRTRSLASSEMDGQGGRERLKVPSLMASKIPSLLGAQNGGRPERRMYNTTPAALMHKSTRIASYSTVLCSTAPPAPPAQVVGRPVQRPRHRAIVTAALAAERGPWLPPTLAPSHSPALQIPASGPVLRPWSRATVTIATATEEVCSGTGTDRQGLKS